MHEVVVTCKSIGETMSVREPQARFGKHTMPNDSDCLGHEPRPLSGPVEDGIGRDSPASGPAAESRRGKGLFQALFDQGPVGIYTCDAEGVIEEFNACAAALWGRTPERGDCRERYCGSHKLFLPDGTPLPHDRTPVASVLRGEAAVRDAEVVMERPDGSQITIAANIVPLLGARGEVAGVMNCFYDITERKRTLTLLADQNAVLELAAAGAPMADVLQLVVEAARRHSGGQSRASLFLLEPDGAHLHFAVAAGLDEAYTRAVDHFAVGPLSPSCGNAAHTGRPVVVGDVNEDPLWVPFLDVVHTFDIRAVWSQPLATVAGKVLGTMALYHRVPRVPGPGELDAIRLLSQTAALVIERTLQAEQREQADAALRQSEQRLRFVMASMPQMICTARPDGSFDSFNPQWMEFTGLPLDRLVGRGWKQFLHPDDLAETVRAWRHAVATGEPYLIEHRFRRADGEYRWHLSRATALRDAGGAVTMWIGSNTDTHDQRQAADELRRTAAALTEADRRKDEFLAMLAHELRNPLAPIRNALALLLRTGGDAAAVRASAEMMERQVGQMVRLVDDLLDVSRVSRGTIDLRKSRVELAAAVNQAVEAARPLCEGMGHDMSVTLPPRPVFLDADPTRLAQAFGNLLNNACKFTDRGGRVWLTAAVEGSGLDAVAVVRVRDTGVGIAADQLPRIFEMFTQVDSSLDRSVGGLGLGLTLVRSLVEMHGGTVTAHSGGVGHGSEFVVRLPAAVGGPGPPPPAAAGPPPVAARRILVVDDNRDAADSLAMLFELTGHDSRAAYDGLEALAVAEAFHPDLVLTDIGLPKLNGYGIARGIRGQPWGAAVALVALTGWGQEEDRRKSAEAGFDRHLVKPVDYATLAKLLAELPPRPDVTRAGHSRE